jgi:endonuclease I
VLNLSQLPGGYSGHYLLALGAMLAAGFLQGQQGPYDPPTAYYAQIEAISGAPLRSQLHDLIDGHWVISYNNLPDLFSVIDADPEIPGNILLIYSGTSVSSGSSSWNREHLWPRSFGAETGPAYSDAHHLFPSNSSTNSDRSNFPFANLSSSRPLANAPDSRVNEGLRLIEPRNADKGRIARAMFYMDVRYDGSDSQGDFYLSDYPASFSTRFGRLSDLLEWNRAYPPDERERRRNHLIYAGVRVGSKGLFQSNRNPFVDYPDLVDAIFTADEVITWGSWRVERFSLAELLDSAVVGEGSDPDADGLPNFLEFALQTDPKSADGALPTLIRTEGMDYFQFGRVPRPEVSMFRYAVEGSIDPYAGNSWTEIPFGDRDLLISQNGLAEMVSLPLPRSSSVPAHYRLRVHRVTPSGEFTAVYDPALAAAGGLDAFTYSVPLEDGWIDSGWMGPVQAEGRPWFYHSDHKWLYTTAADPGMVWFYDFSLGWVYTSRVLYPYLYVARSARWVYYRLGTQAPARVFLDALTATPIAESEL